MDSDIWEVVSALRSSLGLKLAMVMVHLVYAGILFLFYEDLIEETKREPWYVGVSFLEQIWNWVFKISSISLVKNYFFSSSP